MPVISTIASSVAASAAAAGVSTFTYVASWVGSTIAFTGLSALVRKNRQPEPVEKDNTRTQAFSSGPALYPLGRCRTGGVVIFWGEDWNVPNTERFNRNGGADDAHIIIAVGAGECDAIEAIWVGDERFDVKFEDAAKTRYTRREQEKLDPNDATYTRKLAGLPIDLDPGSEAYFNEVQDEWYENPRSGARRLDPNNEGDEEIIRRAALSGSISMWPYLSADGDRDNFRSIREYTDDLDNPGLHRADGTPVYTKFGAAWQQGVHQAKGLACIHIRLRQWTKHKIDRRVFSGDIPQISFLMRGMVITHPDPNATTGTIKQWTNNAAAVRYWWHTVRRGLDPDAINREEFVRAYNICEEKIIPDRPQEWTEETAPKWSQDDDIWGFRRYSIDGVLESGADPSTIEREFDAQWQGVAVEDGGQYHYFPGTDEIETDTLNLDATNAIEVVSINPGPSISDRINALTVTMNQSSFEDYDRQTLEEIRDNEKIDEVDLGITFPTELSIKWSNNPAQAYMLGIINLRRHRASTTYNLTLPVGDNDEPMKYLEMTAGKIYSLNIPQENLFNKRVQLIDKQIDQQSGTISATFMESPANVYAPTYELPDIPEPPPYIPTRLGARPIKPTGLKVDTIARTSSDGTIHFQIIASVDANPLRVKFRLTIGDMILFGETEDNTYTFDVNTDRVQMELAAFHLDSSGIESLPARLIFTPDYRQVIMPTPRWDDVKHYGSQVVMKFKAEEFTNAVSGVEIKYTRLDLDTTANLPILTESNWTTLGELLTTFKLQIVHGVVMTATGNVTQSGRYNIYARYVSNVSGSSPIRGPISAAYGIIIEVPDENLDPATPSVLFDGTMYNLDKYDVRSGPAKGETILLPSHRPANTVRFDNWNGNVSNSSITTDPLPAWPFGQCVGFGDSLDASGRNATTGLWTGGDSTLYRTLPVDLGESRYLDVRAEIYPFEPSTKRASAITFGDQTIPEQKWKTNTAVPVVTFPQATGNFGHITYTLEGLPAGLSFNDAARTVTGTPSINTASGTARYIATDASGGVATLTFSWTVATTVPTPGVMGLVTVSPSITSAVASWTMAANASEYRVEISSTSASTGFTLVGVTVLLTIDLPNLTANTNYWVRVRGESSGGQGQPAVKAFTTNPAIVIPTTPTGFQSVDKTNNTVLLRWDAHANENYYDVRWKLATASEYAAGDIKSSLQINTTSISGLNTLTAYHFQLRAGNSSGVSAWTTPALSVTTADISTTTAQIVSIEHIGGVRPHFSVTTNTLTGETGTEVSHQLVTDDGRFDTSVKTQYEEAGTGPFLIYNVTAGRTYRIGVRKTFFPADGNNLNQLNRATAWVYQTVVFTSVPAPPKPVLLQTNGADYNALSVYARSVVGGTAYRFKWWPTTNPTNVSQAVVTYTPPAGSFYEQSIPYRITPLNDQTEYSVTVEAQNTEGWSNPSDANQFTTTEFQGTPGVIGGLEVYPITHNSVALIWNLDDEAKTYDIEHDGNPNQLVTGVKGDAQSDRLFLPENKGIYIFEALSENTTYVFSIRGRNPDADTQYGDWSDFDSITTPFETLQTNPFTFDNNTPLTLTKGSGRVIAYSIRTTVDSSVHSFQIRFREKQYNTQLPVQVQNYINIPNAAVNTFSSGTRTFTGNFDPGWSNRDWEISVRGYVKDGNGRWDAGFGDWVDVSSVFRNGQFELSMITPIVRQIAGFITTDIVLDPNTEEFETPAGTPLGKTANIIETRINGTDSPIRSTTYRPGSTTPIREGAGVFDPNIWDESGALIGTGTVIDTTERGRTRAARIQVHNVGGSVTTEAAVSNGYINGDKYGDFIYADTLASDVRFVPVKFTNVGKIRSISVGTTYWALRDVVTVNGQKYIGYFLHNSENGARTGTDEVSLLFTDPNIFLSTYDWADVRIEAQGFAYRQLKVGDRVAARVRRTDPNQKDTVSQFVEITLVEPTSVPGAPAGSVRNIRYSLSGRDVVFTWDEVSGVGGYEVSVEEDIPGEPYTPEGGSAQTTTTTVEQASASRTFTKVGGRNEHFTIKIRTYTGNNYGPSTDYVFSPPPATNTVGKVLGFTADDVSDNVRLRWGRVNNATGYEISTSTDNGNTWSTPVTTTQLQYVLVGFSNTNFNVRIRAYKGSAAPYTYSLSYTILSWHRDADEGAGGVGAIKSCVAVSREGAVYLDWTEAPDATRYAIQYFTDNAWIDIADQISTSTTAWQTDLSDADNRDFRVRGETTTANGPWTQVDYIAESDTTLASPTVSSVSSYTTLTVNWAKVGGADAYEVQYRKGTTGSWINASLDATAAPVTISSLEDGTEYQVRVRAKEGTNAGSWSALHTTATLLCSGIAAPTGLTLTPSANVLRASWDRRSEATGYSVEIYTSTLQNSGYGNRPRSTFNLTSTQTSLNLTPYPNAPYWVRIRVRARQGDCPATNWSAFETVRWEPNSFLLSLDTPFTISETGPHLEVGIRLTTQPTADVSLTFGSGNALAAQRATITNGTKTFTPANWNIDQIITITPTNPDPNNIDDTYSDAFRITANGGGYNNVQRTYGATFKDSGVPDLILSKDTIAINEEASTTMTIKLQKQPTATVTVSLNSASTSVATISPSTMTFTTSNWNTTQTATISAPADNDFANSSTSLRIASSGGGYSNIVKTIPVAVTDISQGLVFEDSSSITIDEGSSVIVKAKLAGSPNGFATIRASSADTGAVTVSPAFRNYNNTNWDTYQNFTITAAHDNDHRNESVNVTFEGGLAYTNAPDVVIPVTVRDDDNRNLEISTTSLSMQETGNGSVSVRLTSAPVSGDVTVRCTIANTSVATVSPTSLTFNSSNWDDRQYFTISGVNDTTLTPTRTTTASLVSSGGGYDDTKSVSITVTDNSSPRVFLDTYSVTSKGTPATALVRLTHRPTANVTVAITQSPINGTITFTPSTLTFTTSNWNTSQAVTLNGSGGGGNDARATMIFNPSGGGYDTAPNMTFPARFRDTGSNVTPRIEVSSETLNMNEGQVSAPITMRVYPAGSYRVSLTASPSSKISLSYSSVNTDSSGRVGNGLRITALQDTDASNERVTITASATRISGSGVAIPNKTITVNIDDDETPIIRNMTVTTSSGGTSLGSIDSPLNAGNANSRTISVSLTGRPTSTVRINLNLAVTTGSASNLSLSRQNLTFTVSNWSTTQTFRLDGASTTNEFAATGNITINPSGGGYDNVSTVSVPFTIVDPVDAPELYIQGGAPTELEEGQTLTLNLRMRNQSGNAFIITPSVSPTNIFSFNNTSYEVINGRVPNFVITALHDPDQDTESATITLTAARGSAGSYPIPSPISFTLRRTDDDVNVIVPNPTSLSVKEAASRNVAIRLSGVPTGNVTVTPSWTISDPDASFSPASRTYTTSNWSTPQNFTIKGDVSHLDTRDLTLRFTPSGGGYSSVLNYPVKILNEDEPFNFAYRNHGRPSTINPLTLLTTFLVAGGISLVMGPGFTHTVQVIHNLQNLGFNVVTSSTFGVLLSGITSFNQYIAVLGAAWGTPGVSSFVNYNSATFYVRGLEKPPQGETWQVILIEEFLIPKYNADGVQVLEDDVVVARGQAGKKVVRSDTNDWDTTFSNQGRIEWHFVQGSPQAVRYSVELWRITSADGPLGIVRSFDFEGTIGEGDLIARIESPRGNQWDTLPLGYRMPGYFRDPFRSGGPLRFSGYTPGQHEHPSGSASGAVEGAISASTGGEVATITLPPSEYSYVEPIVVNPEVSPYIEDELALQVWEEGEPIDDYRIPRVGGGAKPYFTAITGLPTGIRYDADSNSIIGQPKDAAPKVGTATIRVEDANRNYDQRTFEWVIANSVPQSWSEVGGGFGRMNNPFQIECATKGNIRPLLWTGGATNAHDLINDLELARNLSVWFKCPTTYPHVVRLTGAASPDFDVLVKVGDDWYISDTADDMEYVKVPGHKDGALICIYRYAEQTTSTGSNNTGEPLILEWVPTVASNEVEANQVGGASGASQIASTAPNEVVGTNTTTRVPGTANTDTYILYRNGLTGIWNRLPTPLNSGWNELASRITPTALSGNNILTFSTSNLAKFEDHAGYIVIDNGGYTGLTNGTVYYINKLSATTASLYNSAANASAGGSTGRINLTGSGTIGEVQILYPEQARQICFEFHLKEWENRGVRRISTHYRDHED